MHCNTNQFSALPFFCPHQNPCGTRGLSNHYHLRSNPKLGHVICDICRISCACVACTSILDKPWISDIPSNKQACYQYVTNCTYWPVLISFNNWNIIQMSQKVTHFEVFEGIHHVVLGGIGDNMASFFQYGKYVSIKTAYTSTDVYCVIKFISESYILQNNTQIDRQIITDV